mgnify:CR=1 FL=1
MNNKIFIGLVLAVLAYSAVVPTALLLKDNSSELKVLLEEIKPLLLAFGAEGDTNLTNIVLSGDLTVDGASTQTGTSTVTQSVDGIVVGGTLTISTTTGRQTLYTNTTGPKLCDTDIGGLVVNRIGVNQAPAIIFSIATSTSSALPGTNLIASTTIATSTDTIVRVTDRNFILANNDTLMGLIADTNANSSSTNFGSWNAEYSVWCTDLSIGE